MSTEAPHDYRIMTLVHACAEMSAEERERFLSGECAGDPELRREVEALADEGTATNAWPAPVHEHARHLPGHYRLIRLLGSGAMGEVFLAEDSRLGRKVAIKFLNAALNKDPDRMRRFNLEARAASALNHPNILTIYDIGMSDAVPYIVSEYVDGGTLASRLAHQRLSPRVCVEITIQIASALGAAHKAGVVHRDLKPDNIMLRRDGTVKVVDFGLAKATDNALPSADAKTVVATSPGIILGTPGYMSPEQTRSLVLDGRSDVFSLGIILFEMLTGHLPFSGRTAVDVISAIISKEPRKVGEYVPDAPADLVCIIDRSLQKDREDRYPSMDAMMADLEGVRADMAWSGERLRTERISNISASALETKHAGRRVRWLYVLPLAAVALILLFGGWWLWAARTGSVAGTTARRTAAITSWSSVSTEGIASASFSPDGRMVAFASKRSGSAEIWVKPTSLGDPIQVTKNGFENLYPVWSPDGQEIAFFSVRGGNCGIWRVSFIGGAETQIVGSVSPQARPVRWSADRKLYYRDGSGVTELFTADTSSGERKQLTDLGSTGMRPLALAISNDGSTIAASVRENGVWKIKLKRLDAAQFADAAESKDPIDSIVFSPKGNSVFYAGVVDGITQIFEAGAGRTPAQISNGNSDFFVQDVSSDGSKILYSSVTETSDLWSVNTADSKESIVANDVAEEYWADISPDGKGVTYEAVNRPDKPFRGSIFVRSAGQQVGVVADGFSPAWSNDGQWIAFFRQNDAGISLWKVPSTGGDPAKLAEGGSLGYMTTPYLKIGTNHISWSPDSNSIAYPISSDGVANIWLIRADGAPSRAITAKYESGLSYCCVFWTRDGSHIVYVSEAARSFRVWMAAADGSDARVIFESPRRFRFLGFNADGSEVVFAEKADANDISQTPAETYINTVSITSGAARRVNTLNNAYFHNINLSKDGRTIAFVSRSNDTSEIWTVPVLGGAAKKLLFEKDPKVMFSSIAWSPDSRTIIFGKQTRTNLLSMLTD